MDITILIPHYRTGKMCAYTLAQILKHSKNHNIQVIIIDNNPRDGSIEYLDPFMGKFMYVAYPKDLLQSHGVAFDYAIDQMCVSTPYFITLESDSFPTNDEWLDYYQIFIDNNYDAVGSLLQLSGGKYIHPTGALWKTEFWYKAKEYCDSIPYHYLPNYGMYNDFAAHVMVHNDIWDFFLQKPDAFVSLPDNRKGLWPPQIAECERHYRPVCGPFHNGMGMGQETVPMIGQRSPSTEPSKIILDGRDKIIHRVGYEPGQWLTYFALAIGRKVAEIPTEIVWMPGRENMQQEYTLTENGIKHLWGVSSFAFSELEEIKDISMRKKQLPEELYETLPAELKIKTKPQEPQQSQ